MISTSPSYVSKNCLKPNISSAQNSEYQSQNVSQSSIQSFSNGRIDFLKDKVKNLYRSSQKQLTPVQSKCGVSFQLGKQKEEQLQSVTQALSFGQDVKTPLHERKEVSGYSAASFFDKVQSVQSYSIQPYDEEERVLLKSIQFDVMHAIKKYENKITKVKPCDNSIKPSLKCHSIRTEEIPNMWKERSSIQDAQVSNMKPFPFIVEGRKQRHSSISTISSKKSVEKNVDNKRRSVQQNMKQPNREKLNEKSIEKPPQPNKRPPSQQKYNSSFVAQSKKNSTQKRVVNRSISQKIFDDVPQSKKSKQNLYFNDQQCVVKKNKENQSQQFQNQKSSQYGLRKEKEKIFPIKEVKEESSSKKSQLNQSINYISSTSNSKQRGCSPKNVVAVCLYESNKKKGYISLK